MTAPAYIEIPNRRQSRIQQGQGIADTKGGMPVIGVAIKHGVTRNIL
jgi:hypothetical protein